MGLSTHVLDTMHGCPAAGMTVSLYTTQGEAEQRRQEGTKVHDRGKASMGFGWRNATLSVQLDAPRPPQ